MDPEAYAGFAASLGAFESMLPRLGEVSCPTTVLVGELDAPFREPSDAMATRIHGSTLVVIEGTGHCPQEDRPDAWIQAVEAHLGSGRRRQRRLEVSQLR